MGDPGRGSRSRVAGTRRSARGVGAKRESCFSVLSSCRIPYRPTPRQRRTHAAAQPQCPPGCRALLCRVGQAPTGLSEAGGVGPLRLCDAQVPALVAGQSAAVLQAGVVLAGWLSLLPPPRQRCSQAVLMAAPRTPGAASLRRGPVAPSAHSEGCRARLRAHMVLRLVPQWHYK